MDWKYDDDLCVCGTKETEIHVLFECKCYDMVRRIWMRTWDVLEEKERTMGVIKGYVEVNDDVENETMKYLGEAPANNFTFPERSWNHIPMLSER